MQWLIDIIKAWVIAQGYATVAWVQAQGYLTHSFVDRGDPAAVDFDNVSLTADGTWRDLDLSAIVPAGAKAVLLAIDINDTLIARVARFRRAGNVNTKNVSEINMQVSGIEITADLVCPVSAARHIEYNLTFAAWIKTDLTVKGWWL